MGDNRVLGFTYSYIPRMYSPMDLQVRIATRKRRMGQFFGTGYVLAGNPKP